jgi:hypothetical protein
MAEDDLLQPLTIRFKEALTLACDLHRGQSRKGTQIPYVSHLLAVASLALEHGATEDEAIAAVLHDAVEDQGGLRTVARIQERFGAPVAEIVQACSDTDVVPKPPWQLRKEAYIAHVRTAPASVRLVSACDKLHNARSILGTTDSTGNVCGTGSAADATERSGITAPWSRRSAPTAGLGSVLAALQAPSCRDVLMATIALRAPETRSLTSSKHGSRAPNCSSI